MTNTMACLQVRSECRQCYFVSVAVSANLVESPSKTARRDRECMGWRVKIVLLLKFTRTKSCSSLQEVNAYCAYR